MWMLPWHIPAYILLRSILTAYCSLRIYLAETTASSSIVFRQRSHRSHDDSPLLSILILSERHTCTVVALLPTTTPLLWGFLSFNSKFGIQRRHVTQTVRAPRLLELYQLVHRCYPHQPYSPCSTVVGYTPKELRW